ncbi:hypothetical protein [Methylobacterium oxalidis]|uniref:hypothetical protein n=1 Tax=Methylobacterium oxalidis TaxID=944322 RepID=UPI003315935F
MPVELLHAPIEVRGDWRAPEQSALAVVRRVRDVSLSGLTLRSDHQPESIWVQNNTSGPPAIWLHDDPARVAWIYVNIGERAWTQLAYQFGHELGHVLANSWERDATGPPPSRWLEETLVESFSVRGLRLLAESWKSNPPFPGDESYGASINEYREATLAQYQQYASDQGATDLSKWYMNNAARLEREGALGVLEQAVVPALLSLIEPESVLVEDYNGLNRWPERTGLPLPLYLRKWRQSCAEIEAPGRLPVAIAELLGIPIK